MNATKLMVVFGSSAEVELLSKALGDDWFVIPTGSKTLVGVHFDLIVCSRSISDAELAHLLTRLRNKDARLIKV